MTLAAPTIGYRCPAASHVNWPKQDAVRPARQDAILLRRMTTTSLGVGHYSLVVWPCPQKWYSDWKAVTKCSYWYFMWMFYVNRRWNHWIQRTLGSLIGYYRLYDTLSVAHCVNKTVYIGLLLRNRIKRIWNVKVYWRTFVCIYIYWRYIMFMCLYPKSNQRINIPLEFVLYSHMLSFTAISRLSMFVC